MGKSEAKKRADAGGISIGELREMIVKARGKRVECNLNPQLTHEQALPDMDTKRRMTKRSPSIRGRRSSRRSGRGVTDRQVGYVGSLRRDEP